MYSAPRHTGPIPTVLRRLVATIAVVVPVVLAGCRDTAPTASPAASPTPLAPNASALPCSTSCPLTVDDAPFAAAAVPSDSVSATLSLAGVRVAGAPGAVVRLMLDAPPGTSSRSSSRAVVVRVNGTTHTYSMAELADGVDVHQFAAHDTVMVEYRLARGLAAPAPGAGRIVQRLTGGATVLQAARPWVPLAPAGTSRFLAAGAPGTPIPSGFRLAIARLQ